MLTRRFVDDLYRVQEGKCFHCGEEMVWGNNWRRMKNKLHWSKEHVYPRKTHRGINNNIVLAHRSCNTARGHRPPTDDEIERTKKIYAAMNLVAFQPFNSSHKRP